MRVVISLTTIPSRVPHLQDVIDSLLNQTYPVDRIYVNLPDWSNREKCKYPIPRLRKDKRIQLIRCRDYGPITKLYPMLEHETDPETFIITVDDDLDYVPNRVEILVQWAQKHPETAIGGSGFTVGSWWSFFGFVRRPSKPTWVSVLEGTSGCIYRRRFFSNDLIDYRGAPEELHYQDDVWISGYLARRGIPRLVHPAPDGSVGLAGIGSEKRLPNGLSHNWLGFIKKLLPSVLYFRKEGHFNEEPSLSWLTVGFWALFLLLFLLIILLVVLIRTSAWAADSSRPGSPDLQSRPSRPERFVERARRRTILEW